MKAIKYLFLFSLLSAQVSWAQEFLIHKVELTAETVVIHYNLIDTTRERRYTVNVYSSKDNFLAPLQKILGDAGLEVTPGLNRKITWRSKEELGSTFSGDVEIEIRGRVYIPFIRFNDFQENMAIKRGKAKTLTWTGGTRQNILNFAIYKDDKFVDVIPNIANAGSYDVVLPTSIKPGKNYYFMVSDSKNKDQVMKTKNFTVKRKLPLVAKVLPVALVATIVPLLTGGSDSSRDLETPPGPPDNPN